MKNKLIALVTGIAGGTVGIGYLQKTTWVAKHMAFPAKTQVSDLILPAAFSADSSTPPGASQDSCFAAFREKVAAAPAVGTYTHPILDHLHSELYRFNKLQTADVELIFCRLVNVMGFDPDLSNLPQTLTKTDPLGGTMVATVSAPTEAFATTKGYTAKAELKYNDTLFLTLWWTGSGSSSKGFLIQSKNPMQTDGNTRLRYVEWDLTTADQTVKILGTQFATAYLSSVSGSTNSVTGGDQAVYARLTFNSGTKAMTGQAVEIRKNRTVAEFKCVRTYTTGTLGGTIAGYRPAQGTPEAVTSSLTGGGSGMDGETGITDATTSADHSGTPSPGTAVASGTFDHSCSDINGAATVGASFSPFAGGTVDFTKAPVDIFPN